MRWIAHCASQNPENGGFFSVQESMYIVGEARPPYQVDDIFNLAPVNAAEIPGKIISVGDRTFEVELATGKVLRFTPTRSGLGFGMKSGIPSEEWQAR